MFAVKSKPKPRCDRHGCTGTAREGSVCFKHAGRGVKPSPHIVLEKMAHRRNAIAIRWRCVTEPAMKRVAKVSNDYKAYVAEHTRVANQMLAIDAAMLKLMEGMA